jgi:hypothetical protein
MAATTQPSASRRPPSRPPSARHAVRAWARAGRLGGGCGLTLWRYATTPSQCFQYAGNAANARAHFAQADLAKSALFMVSNNIGQIAYLNAHKHGVATIYFAGSFIRGHPDTMKTISYAVNFWSQGAMTGTPQPHGSARMCVHGCAYLCM